MPPKLAKNKERKKAQWSQSSLETAFKLYNDGKSIREAARCTGIPFSTLQERLKNKNKKTPVLGRNTTFTTDQELEMASQVKTLAKIFYGCSADKIKKAAFTYAVENGIPKRFNSTKGMAGKDWLNGFLERNNLSVRKSEGTSLNRATAFNREEVGIFFELLGNLYEKFNFPPQNIFNVDETGVTTVQDPGRVVAEKGQKRVGSITSGERGQNVTAVCAVSATGHYIPSMFIYPRKRHSKALESNGPREAEYKCSKNGWINEELFVEWLQHFVKFSKPTETSPVLLILDNHSSHITWRAYEFCKENYIVMLSLPPHGSHRMQPLDVSVFGPFKKAYRSECDIFMKSSIGQKITPNDIASLFKKAFQRVATQSNAEAGFSAAGIYPYDPHKFTDEDFMPADIMNDVIDARNYDENRHQESPSLLDDFLVEPIYNNPDLQLVDDSISAAEICKALLSVHDTENVNLELPSLPHDISESDSDPCTFSATTITVQAQIHAIDQFGVNVNNEASSPSAISSKVGRQNSASLLNDSLVRLTSQPIYNDNPAPLITSQEIVSVKDLLSLPRKIIKAPQPSRKQHATIITSTPNKIILFQKEQKKLAKVLKAEAKTGDLKKKEVKNKKTKITATKNHNRKILSPVNTKKDVRGNSDNETGSDSEIEIKNTKLSLVNRIKKRVLQDENDEGEVKKIKQKQEQISLSVGKRHAGITKKKNKKEEKGKKTETKIITMRGKKIKTKGLQADEDTSNSEIDMKDLVSGDDGDTDDDLENKCVICNDYGRNNELWYRCVLCGLWAHAECSGRDSAEGYICDLCENK